MVILFLFSLILKLKKEIQKIYSDKLNFPI